MSEHSQKIYKNSPQKKHEPIDIRTKENVQTNNIKLEGANNYKRQVEDT